MPGDTSTGVSWGETLNTCEKNEALLALRNHLKVAPPHQVQAAINTLQLAQLFQCLDTKDDKQVETACEVLEVCFSNLSIDYVVKEATDNMFKSLSHRNSTVRRMAITEICREIKISPTLYPLPENLHIAIAVLKCICDEDLGISSKAGEAISSKDWIQHPQFVAEMNLILENANTSNRCKCYEVILSILKNFPDKLKDQSMQTFLHKLITELETTDLLFKMNVMEMLSNVADVPNGLDFLIENNVMKQMSEMAGSIHKNPIGDYFIPGLMRFFGTIAHKYPTEIINNYPIVVDLLFQSLNKDKSSFLPSVLDTLGFIGSTIEGKLALGSLGRVFIDAMSRIGYLIKNCKTEVKIRSLNCIEYLVGVRCDEENEFPARIDQRVTLMTREWFREVSERPTSMELVYDFCKIPFPDLQTNAFKCLAAICQHRWGMELVRDTAGMAEFLLDRSVQCGVEAKHIKYDIILALSKSDILDTESTLRYKTYVQEGPFFVQGVVDVAIEGEE